MIVVRGLFRDVRCVWFGVCCLLFVVRCSRFVVRRVLLVCCALFDVVVSCLIDGCCVLVVVR